jgi:hypothetical protein
LPNAAFHEGRKAFDWWPDWRRESVAIIASGPSAKSHDLKLLAGLKVIAIKENVELYPRADIVYGCDGAWWRHRQGLKAFRGLKIAYDPRVCDTFADIKRVEIAKTTDRILTAAPLHIGSGGNSGFQALNLAVQFGAKRIMLIGFDMTDRSGVHWYGRNNWMNANNPSDPNFRRWMAAFHASLPDLEGVLVVNVSPTSVLKAFPRISLAETLQDWSK